MRVIVHSCRECSSHRPHTVATDTVYLCEIRAVYRIVLYGGRPGPCVSAGSRRVRPQILSAYPLLRGSDFSVHIPPTVQARKPKRSWQFRFSWRIRIDNIRRKWKNTALVAVGVASHGAGQSGVSLILATLSYVPPPRKTLSMSRAWRGRSRGTMCPAPLTVRKVSGLPFVPHSSK